MDRYIVSKSILVPLSLHCILQLVDDSTDCPTTAVRAIVVRGLDVVSCVAQVRAATAELIVLPADIMSAASV